MTLPLIAVGFALGCALGSGLRCGLRDEWVDAAISGSDSFDTPRLAQHRTGNGNDALESIVTIEEICQAQSEDFLTQLLAKLTTATSQDLDQLLQGLLAEDRLEHLAKDLIFLRWMEIDPHGGLAAGKAIGQAYSAYWSWAKVDRDAALAHAQASGNPNWLGQVVRAIGQDDPETGIALIEDVLPEGSRSGAWQGTLAAIAHEDPERAMDMALKLRRWDKEIVQEWIRRDPLNAFSWLFEKVPKGDGHRFKAAFEGLLKTSPNRAVEVLNMAPTGWHKARLQTAYASYLSATDADHALFVLEGLSENMRDYALADMAQRNLQLDPEKVYDFLREINWADPSPNPALIGVEFPGNYSENGGDYVMPDHLAAILAERDPARASAFLETLPPSELSESAYQEVVKKWMNNDPAAVSRWVVELHPGPLKDVAITTMIKPLTYADQSSVDFEAAALWTLQISADKMRERQLNHVFSQWKNSDAEAMLSGLELPGIPDSFKQSFLP